MPLVVYALAAYVAGLYAGFGDSIILLVAAAAGTFGVGFARGAAVRTTLSALAIAGYLVATSAVRDDARCLESTVQAGAAAPIRLVIADSVSPGGFVPARMDKCNVAASLSVANGSAEAGSTVSARGQVLRTRTGVLVQHATITEVRGPPLLAAWRTSAGRTIDRTFGADAPLVRALLIADRTALAPSIRDAFAAAGLAHMLAIAGLHIGIIAAAIALLLELAGVARRRASIITMAVVVVYVALIGAPIPAVRSATMLMVFLAARLMQRPTSRWAIVALGASQPIIAPRVVLEVGYQLSVVGVASMIAAGRVGRRMGVSKLPWIRRAVVSTFLGTTVATIGTAPIVAWVFGRVSLIAPLTNVAAMPLIALAQPMIFCALLLARLPPLAAFVADAAHPLLAGLQRVAIFGAGVPFASPPVSPTPFAAVLAGIVSGAVIVACASRESGRAAMIGVVAAAALVWLPLAPMGDGMLELHMIDVGQGDAVALRTPHGHWALIDAGRAWKGGDAGTSTVVPYIGRRGGTLDVFVLTHPHTDHVGGAASVLRALHPSLYVDGGFPGAAEAYRASLDVARTEHVRWTRAHPGDTVVVDGITLRFLAPDSAWTSHLVDPNLASVVTLVQFGAVRMLLMGDAERAEEEWLLTHEGQSLRADVLKVGHHGSSTSSSETFLDSVRPRVALVSVGTGNMYHLPTPAVIRRLGAHGAEVLRTDHLGTVVVRTDGVRLIIQAAGDEWELPGGPVP